MVRCMPQKARARLLSLAGCTEMAPSWTSYAMSSTTGMLSVPLGPFTDSVPSAIEAVTPDGTEIGFFPIRDMGAGSLEYFCQHLAADVLGPRFRVGQNALWRRDDGDAQAIANARKLLRAGIDAATRLRHARDVLDRRLALEILQLDANALHGAHRFFGIAADIALALQHVENALTQLGSRREDTVLARLLAVADAGEHITQGIGDRHLGISLPARLRNTGDQAVIGQFPQHHAAELKLTIISAGPSGHRATVRSEEHTSELQSLMRISYAVFCLKKKHKQRFKIQETTRK